jgi:DNA-binding transcriptional LysR family regulator
MADNLALMHTFAEVAATGSFSTAARALGISRAAVSHQVARLESHLGVRLFTRTTRRVVLTPEGERYAAKVGAILDQLEALDNEYAQRAGEVAGPLVVEVPEFFGTRVLAARLPEFLHRHPRVRLQLVLNEKVDEVASAEADVFVRGSLPPAHHLKYRRLTAYRLTSAASPAYLATRGTPRHPRDLASHDTVDYINSAAGKPFDWEFEPVARGRPGAKPFVVPAQGKLTCNNSDACLAAAVAGFGVVCDVDFMLDPLFRSGALVPVLPGWRSPEYQLHALWHPGKPVAPRVSAFVEFLSEISGARR